MTRCVSCGGIVRDDDILAALFSARAGSLTIALVRIISERDGWMKSGEIAKELYAVDPAGGPRDIAICISQMAKRANQAFEKAGCRYRVSTSHASGYRLEFIKTETEMTNAA